MDNGPSSSQSLSVQTFADSRRTMRHRVDLRLKVTVPGAGGTTSSAFGRANTLSHLGLGVYIPCSIPQGSVVVIELVLPSSSKETTVKAIVRSCEGFRYGLEFTDMTESTKSMIARSCESMEVSC